MAEYIERNAAIEVALSCTDAFEPIAVDTTVKNVVSKLRNIPYADVQPVTHGKWEEVHEWMGDVEYSCSVCGCYALWKELTTDQVCTEYCPNCGAKMDGDKNG